MNNEPNLENPDEPMPVVYESSDSCDTSSIKNDEAFDQNSVLDVLTSQSDEIDSDLKNLQKVDIFLQQLPFFEQVKHCAFKTFDEIKESLAKSVALNEIRPGFCHWTNKLIIFIHEYGLFFTKQDHIKLVKLFLSVVVTPNIDLPVVDICFQVLGELLKKFDKLTPKELQIEWRPLYELYVKMTKIDDYSPVLGPENIEQNSFPNFIRFARLYFEPSATAEILAELRPLLCPFDVSMNRALERLKLFLPTIFDEEIAEPGYKLWLVEFLDLWTTLSTRNYWESHILNLFARVANNTIGQFDWSPYIPFIFSNILRGFGLPFSSKDSLTLGVANTATSASINNNMSQAFVYNGDDISSIATWIVSMIGVGQNRNLCLEHIKRLFQALRSFYYPSNSGSWSANLFAFLQYLPERLIRRLKRERKDKKKWYTASFKAEFYLRDDEVIEFVNALKPVAFTAIFSKNNQSDARKAFQSLTFLRGELMLPALIQKVYESIESLTEPHRYTSILGCLVSVAREIATFNANHADNQTRMHVIPLLSAVLPGIDPNDSHKTLLTNNFLSYLLNCIIVCDCAPALNVRTDLTEHEKELIFQTGKFEDFVHELFAKVFNYVENLASSDISSESSAAAAAAQTNIAANKNNEDASLVSLLNVLRALIRQSSKPILKVILNKVRNFLTGNRFNTRAGKLLGGVCYYLTESAVNESAFETFLNYVFENLRKIKESPNYEHVLQNERGDIEITWNLQLLSELVKADGLLIVKHMNQIRQLINWFRPSVHKESSNYIAFSLRNILISLVQVNQVESRSVNYSIAFDEPNEFFKNHLPIRDWARPGDIFKLNLNLHIPDVAELETAIDFLDEQLNKSIRFLTESIMRSGESQAISKSSKEERNRELCYINLLIYGASTLLKRPSGKRSITEHIDSCVEFGMKDEMNKGLGFEIVNVNNPNHAYFKLSERHKDILLNMRLKVVEFIISLAEKLIEQNSTETTLFVYIMRILNTATITYRIFASDFEKLWKAHNTTKNAVQNKLLGKKSSTRDELISRVMLQYLYRVFHIHSVLNEVDWQVIELLFKLSTDSIYAVVRKEAQTQLFSVLSNFPYSTLLIVPRLAELLQNNNQQALSHDQLKGCLYLLRGNNLQESIMIKQNWQVLLAIWPVVFQCQHFEKPSIQTLLDKIFLKTNKEFDSFDNRVEFSGEALEAAFELHSALRTEFGENEKRLSRFREKTARDNQAIAELMSKLVRISRESQFLWKSQATSFGALMFLISSCEMESSLLTEECVRLIVDSLVNENIKVRKIADDALCVILKMVKPAKETKLREMVDVICEETRGALSVDSVALNVNKPGYRVDNQFHVYDTNFLSSFFDTSPASDEEKWSRTSFLDKSYWGYYCWPAQIRVAAKRRVKLAKFAAAIRPVEERFANDSQFVAKFIQLSTIEESKGNEKFDKKRFYLFKALFRNFGSADAIHGLFEHLAALVKDRENKTHECSHKLAAEIICGLIRGSKYWPLQQLKQLWSQLKVIFDLVVENITTETVKLWTSCFSTVFEDQDPRRMTFYISYFSDLTKRIFRQAHESGESSTSASSFQQSSCLQLIGSLNQMEWRIPSFWTDLLDIFLANMSHPYKAIREKNSSCITLCIVNDIDYSKSLIGAVNKAVETRQFKSDNLKKFIDYAEARLSKAIELFDKVNEETIDAGKGESKDSGDYKSGEHLEAINFLQSLFGWFGYYMMKSFQPINTQLIRIIPHLCSVDKIAAQDVSLKSLLPMIRMFVSLWILDKDSSHFFIEQLKKITKFKSWHSRLAAIQMFQNYGIFNLFLVDEEVKNDIKEILMSCLCDEQLEVRLSAALSLTGFIHSNFFQVKKDLIDHFKTLSKASARKKDKTTGKFVINMPNLIKRHAGVLGLCAIVGSCPYDVPEYLPEVVTYMCNFIEDPVPIQGSVRKCLSEFRRTHYDNWQEHKQSFNEEQLSTLTDILISPSYYA